MAIEDLKALKVEAGTAAHLRICAQNAVRHRVRRLRRQVLLRAARVRRQFQHPRVLEAGEFISEALILTKLNGFSSSAITILLISKTADAAQVQTR